MTQVVGHYNLLERIGSGGMGEMFRARDTERGRTVAVKLLPPGFAADPERRERFMEDARAAACLSHPAVATLVETGEADGRLFLVSEFVAGRTLTQTLAGGPMPPRQAVAIAIQVADALAEGHAAGIIHRDLKPDNIIVTPAGAAKVLDFGLAAWTSGGMAREMVTAQVDIAPSLVLGTLAYMSPEQALAQGLDARSDIFSLGIVLYQMLTARNPFGAPTSAATLVNLLQVDPAKPSTIQSEIPPRLDEIVKRALSKDVEKRYETAAQFAADLREVFGERTEIIEGPADEVAPVTVAPSSGRGRLAVLLIFLALVIGGAAAAYLYRQSIESWWRHRFGPPPAPVVAVMPFDEVGNKQTYFADGFTGDVITRLGQISGLRVVGRSATRAYRGREPAEVARELGAAVVLTGSVQRDQGDLKITVELIDPSDGVRVWRQQFVNAAGTVVAAQAQIATAVAEALRLPLAPNVSRERSLSRSVSPEAYDLYTKAQEALTARDLDGAVRLFDRAILLDGGLAEAHAGLAQALYLRAQFAGTGVGDAAVQARVRDAASRAAAIDPDLAVVEVAQAMASPNIPDSVRHLVRAATLDPTYGEVYHYLADDLVAIDSARAMSLYEKSRALEPRLADNYADMMALSQMRGDRKKADAIAAGLRRMSPRAVPAPPMRILSNARTAYAEGRKDEAAKALQQLIAGHPDFCEAKAVYAGVLLEAKRTAEARALADPLVATGPAACAATAAAALGNAPATAAALRRIAADGAALRGWLQTEDGVNGEYSILLRRYPWPKVIEQPDVAAALAELRGAYARTKASTDKELRLLPRS